jgi:5-methylcytosine-specific restriction endonuclease McrA
VGRALVLNASYEPLCAVSTRRALVLVLGGRAEIVHEGDGVFRSESMQLPEPSVVRLSTYVKVPHLTRVAVSRRSVFARDNGTCQYCGDVAESIDHVVPRSKGGPHAWENVVAACKSCNSRKRDLSVKQAGMKLRSRPHAPTSRVWVLAASGSTRPEWSTYLGQEPLSA